MELILNKVDVSIFTFWGRSTPSLSSNLLSRFYVIISVSFVALIPDSVMKHVSSTPVMLNDNLFSHIFTPCRCVLFPLMLKMKKHVSYKKTLLLKTSPIHTQCTPVEAVRGVGRRAVAGMVGILLWHCTAYVSVKVTNQCFFGSYERCPGLTHALPNVAKVNIQQNFQISFCKMLKNKFICGTMAQKVSFKRSHHRILCTDSKVRITSVAGLPCRLWEEIAGRSTNFLYYVRRCEFRREK